MVLGKIDHIDFTVGDIKKTEEFMIKKMGFTLLRKNVHADKSISHELTSPAGDFIVQIHKASEADLKKRREDTSVPPMYFNHIAFKVDDVDVASGTLKSKGVSFKDATHVNPVNGRKVVTANDDEGRSWIQLSG